MILLLGRTYFETSRRCSWCQCKTIYVKKTNQPGFHSTSILHPSSLSSTGCLCNFVFNTNWLFWFSVISRVLFLHICPLFCIFINLRVFFAHLLKNCSKFPGLTLSQPVNAHFILLPRLFGTRFQAVFVTSLISCNSRLIWKPICSVKLFPIHSSCVFFLFFVRPEFFGRFCAL